MADASVVDRLGGAGSSPLRPAAAQIDQLHAATRAKNSLFSAAVVARNFEMPLEQITDGPNRLRAQKLM